jgi:ABC-type amino acid transport substrate-binding protein
MALALILVCLTTLAFAGGQNEPVSGNRRSSWLRRHLASHGFVNADKEMVGFDIDLMKLVAEAGGFEVEFRNTAWDGIFAGLKNSSTTLSSLR